MSTTEKYYFICEACGTNYSSSQKEPPPGIPWTDGHRCNPVPKDKRIDLHKSLIYNKEKGEQ